MSRAPDILTPRELAARARVSDRTIVAMARRGDIPGAFQVGKQWRFHRDLAVPHLLPRPATLADSCRSAAPQSASTTANAKRTGPSDGENTDDSSKKERTIQNPKRSTRRTSSVSAFARDFPEYAHLAR